MSIPKIDLSDFIEKWKSAKRGKEVRQASTDAFEQIQRIVNEALQKCYDEATGNPESILAHTGNTKNPHETKAANLPVTDTYGAAGTAGNTVFMQALADALADKIVNQVLTKGELINNALATEAGVAALDAAMGKTLQDQITQQNSNLSTKFGYITDGTDFSLIPKGIHFYNGWASASMTNGVAPFSNSNGIWIRSIPYNSIGSNVLDVVIAANGTIYTSKDKGNTWSSK